MVTTVAPDHRASWMAAWPTAPAPPATRTVRPSSVPGPRLVGPSTPTVSARWAVRAGIPRLAPTSKEVPAGRATAWSSAMAISSWAVPSDRCQAASHSHTRSPIRPAATPGPTATIVPAPSWLGTVSGDRVGSPGRLPLRTFQSVGLTPDTSTRTSTSPGPGAGAARSTRRSTSGPPVSLYTTALIGANLPTELPRSDHR